MSPSPPAVSLVSTHGPAPWIALACCIVALLPSGARWLRVAQREHYLAGATTRFAWRWWTEEPGNVALVAVAAAGVGCSVHWPLAALASAGVAVVGPLHLGVRGRTSKLVATRRLRTLAAAWLVLEGALIGLGVGLGATAPFAAGGLLLAPLFVDGALAALGPWERRLANVFVRSAADRLARVRPVVVAVTGSFGKTSTKHHLAHLLSGSKVVVASPASFNNRAGLARAVNEHLADGTEVFVAEMGTYGPGEIRDLCAWCPPDLAAITAIGPVHLERFGSEDRILTAKAEIAEHASVVALNVDDDRLAGLGERLAEEKDVVRCSARDRHADVCVLRQSDTVSVYVSGDEIARDVPVSAGIQPTNLAVAVALALRLGVAPAALAARLATLPAVANRLVADRVPSGLFVIDDTFNANPAGTRAALAALASAPAERRRAVVTPGMVELGSRQAAENEAFGQAASAVATDFVIVGRTNRRALRRGAAALQPVIVRTRAEAVAWVRTHLGIGDAVLYENDLPDHYP